MKSVVAVSPPPPRRPCPATSPSCCPADGSEQGERKIWAVEPTDKIVFPNHESAVNHRLQSPSDVAVSSKYLVGAFTSCPSHRAGNSPLITFSPSSGSLIEVHAKRSAFHLIAHFTAPPTSFVMLTLNGPLGPFCTCSVRSLLGTNSGPLPSLSSAVQESSVTNLAMCLLLSRNENV